MANNLIYIISKTGSGKPLAVGTSERACGETLSAIGAEAEVLSFIKWQREVHNKGLSKGFANAMARCQVKKAVCFVEQETGEYDLAERDLFIDGQLADYDARRNLLIARSE